MLLAKIRTPRPLILQRAVCLRVLEQTGAGISSGSTRAVSKERRERKPRCAEAVANAKRRAADHPARRYRYLSVEKTAGEKHPRP
jgi:hypothetical protein